MQENVYQSRIEDVDELRERIKAELELEWISALSILQSGSGALAFMHMSRQKAITLTTMT